MAESSEPPRQPESGIYLHFISLVAELMFFLSYSHWFIFFIYSMHIFQKTNKKQKYQEKES